MTNLLAIETSGPVLSVAVKKGKWKTREMTLKGYFRHAENLLPLIDKLLKKERLKIHQVSAFLIGRGPGSFTGLRVGFATLKGLIAVDPKPCFGAFSMDLIAGNIPVCKTGELHVCLDAKRGKLYSRSYRYLEKIWKPRGTVAVGFLEEIIERAAKGSWIVGDGITTDKLDILKQSKKKFRLLPEKSWYPKASTLIEWFGTKDPRLKALTRPKELLPFYLRSSEAEERLRK